MSRVGRLSPDLIVETDPRYAERVETVLRWLVFKAQVRTDYPDAVAKASRPVVSCVLAPECLKIYSSDADDLTRAPFDRTWQVSKNPTDCRSTRFFLAKLDEKERCGAFWFVELTDDKALANMVITTASVCSSRGCVMRLPQDSTVKRGKVQSSKWAPRTRISVTTPDQLSQLALSKPDVGQQIGEGEDGLPEDASQDSARIPVLVNSKPLEPGQYLYYFQEKKTEEKQKRPLEPITITNTLRKKGRRM